MKIIWSPNTIITLERFRERDSDLTSATATTKKPLTNQMRLIYSINQSDAFNIFD